MTRPVNTVPPLPYPGGRNDNRSLAAFDQDLVKALQIYLGELARRANAGLGIDGTDAMTGDLNMGFNDLINAISLTIVRSASITNQGLTIGPSNATGHFIRGFSPPTNAKNIFYNATTDDLDTAPSAGANRHVFQIRGVDKLTIDDDGDVTIVDKTYLQWTGDISSASSDNHALQIGPSNGVHVAFDTNEIQARNNGAVNALGLQNIGGDLNVGLAGSAYDLMLNHGHLTFPASPNPSANANTLDDYAESSWTPTLTFTTPGDVAVTYSAQVGRYIKIGKQVTIWGRIVTTAFTWTTASGELRIDGIPFTSANVGMEFTGSVEAQQITTWGVAGYTQLNANIPAGASSVRLVASAPASNRAAVQANDMTSGTNVTIFIQLTYEAAN